MHSFIELNIIYSFPLFSAGMLYCVHNNLKKRKNLHRHLPNMTIINAREDNNYLFHSSDEDSDSDVKQLIKTDTDMDKTKSFEKEIEVDNSLKTNDEDEPIYEECSIRNN